MRDKRAGLVLNAVRQFCNSRADPVDCLVALIAAEAGCEHTVTFDRDAARHAGTRLLA